VARRRKPAAGKPAANKGAAGKAARKVGAVQTEAVEASTGPGDASTDEMVASQAPAVEAMAVDDRSEPVAALEASPIVEETPAAEDTAQADSTAHAPPAPKPRVRHAAIDPFATLAEYERRSLAHVVGLPEQLDAPGLWRGVGYRIGQRRLASGFNEVVEILPMPAVTPVPGAQPWMLGVANIRGNLLPIVDLKQFLEGERTVLHESQRVLIVRQPGGDVAVTIDELFGQRSFLEEQQIEAAPLAEGRYTHFIDKAYSLNDVSWGIFSLDRLARTPEFRQAAA